MLKYIFINGDDFGISDKTSKIIARFIQSGYIDSTSVMVNMPNAENAYALAEEQSFVNKIGLHLNFIEGYALSDKMKKCSLFCDSDGFFNREYKRHRFKRIKLSNAEKQAVYDETEAQIKRFIELGYTYTKLDSHQGIHTDVSLMPIIFSVCKKYGFTYVRRSPNFNINTTKKKLRRAVRKISDSMILRSGIKTSNWFGNIKDIKEFPEILNNDGTLEIMVHPQFKNGQVYIDYFSGCLLQDYMPILDMISSYKDKL